MFDCEDDEKTVGLKMDFGIGKMKLEDGWKNGEEQGFMGTESGVRDSRVYIKFNIKFEKIPHVHVGLSYLDTGNEANTRIKVYAENISKEGFELVFGTWADSIVWGAEANWMAIQN